jgi:hypothetical protein
MEITNPYRLAITKPCPWPKCKQGKHIEYTDIMRLHKSWAMKAEYLGRR